VNRVNQAPVASADAYTTPENQPLTVYPLLNDLSYWVRRAAGRCARRRRPLLTLPPRGDAGP
jgi:hypothetical protein